MRLPLHPLTLGLEVVLWARIVTYIDRVAPFSATLLVHNRRTMQSEVWLTRSRSPLWTNGDIRKTKVWFLIFLSLSLVVVILEVLIQDLRNS